jgi:predicted amidophosphoribosyltransferase
MSTAEIMSLFIPGAANEPISTACARPEIAQCATADLNLCPSCAHELRSGDKFCRRCGAAQSHINATPGSAEARYKTAPLPHLGGYRRVSGPLVGSLAADISARAAQINNGTLRRAVLALIVLPLWLLIILLSPFDAYAAAKAIIAQG